MATVEVPNEDRTAEVMKDFLASIGADQAATISELPQDQQLQAALKLAERINLTPWPTHDKMTGRKDPLVEIDWDAPPVNSNS